MTRQPHKTFHILYHPGNKRALFWVSKIKTFVKKRFVYLKTDSKKPGVVIVLGGDGTILEAARKYQKVGSIILGLNLGRVGFLASVRREKDFLPSLAKFFKGRFRLTERMMISAQVKRKGKLVYSTEALNEIAVKNPIGILELQTKIAGHPVQYVRGTGILVATATGSTAYNLSAHGPIVMPNIKCLIVTEILDHSIPSPSVVVKYDNIVKIELTDFRKSGLLSLTKNKQKIDVLLLADGQPVLSLEKGDEIIVESSPHLIKFAELEKHYFFKSLEEQFGFK